MPPPNTPEEGLAGSEDTASPGTPTSGSRRLSRRFTQLIRPRSAGSELLLSDAFTAASPAGDASPNSPPRSSSVGVSSPPDLLPIDYQSLVYAEPVDDALQCPICRTAFHEPVTTKQCGHTFCSACLKQAYEIQPICPVDRQPVKVPQDTCTTRVLSHQLDRLRVDCPNHGCAHTTTRNLLEAHYERYCKFTLVRCPDPACNLRVRRCDATAENGCLHRDTECVYCGKTVLVAGLETHYDKDCCENTVKCAFCDDQVVPHRMDKHVDSECPETEIRCQWHTYGCPVEGRRGTVQQHESVPCVYKAIGQLVKEKVEDRRIIDDLRSRLEAAEARPHARVALNPSFSLEGNGQQPGATAANGGSWDSPEDFLLAQFESMETRFEELRKTVTELDGRHSMMLLNETLPIKNQITELRSLIGVVNMHTTWLMNAHRRDRGQQRNAAVAAAAAAGSALLSGSSAQDGSATPRSSGEEESHYYSRRRMSDGRNEQAPRL